MSWAKLSLARGNSANGEWSVDQNSVGSRVEVGSDPSCSWVVSGGTVAAKHLEIYWDGEVLWVARIEGAPEVRVDGLMVDDWYAVAKGSTIEFGGATLIVSEGAGGFDTSSLASRVGETSDVNLGHADAATAIAKPGASYDPHSVPNAATAILQPRDVPAPALSAAATQILGPSGSDDEAAGRIAAFEADLGNPHETQQVPSAGGLPGAQATQLVSLPGERPPSGPAAEKRRPPPPRFGQNVKVNSAAAPSPPVPPAPASVATPPAPAPAGASGDVAPSPENPDAPASPFAAAPAFDPKARKKRGPSGKRSLPTRTWLLLGAVVVALLVVSFMGNDEDVTSPPAPDGGQGAAAPSADGGVDGGATDIVDSGAPADAALTPTDAGPPVDAGATELIPLENRAAEAVIANHFSEAFGLYTELVERHPDNEAYAAMCEILRDRIQASCRNGVDQQGNACEVD
ncbi:MAG: hypothetical protein DRJ42_27605 [Deltaproteobacteria bacterium]|nr:MAG: hypothetical protein DRJ42_27605 [Deltaproteobacteria bacterium]